MCSSRRDDRRLFQRTKFVARRSLRPEKSRRVSNVERQSMNLRRFFSTGNRFEDSRLVLRMNGKEKSNNKIQKYDAVIGHHLSSRVRFASLPRLDLGMQPTPVRGVAMERE